MKRLFLTSSARKVIKNIAREIGTVKGMKLAFIYTPAEFKKGGINWQDEDRTSLTDVGFEVFDYTITGKSKDQIKKDLDFCDVIFFSGGNQLYTLEKLQETGSLSVFRSFVQKGKIFIGARGGAMVFGPDLYCTYRPDIENEVGGLKLKNYKGLGLVNFVIFPHWGSEKFKDKYFGFRLKHAYTPNDKIILLTNYQYVEVVDDWYRIVEVKH